MDSANQSVLTILGSDEYDCFENLVVFDEHDETDKDGKVVRKFDKARLQKIAETCNLRFQKDSCPAMIGPGHTILDKKAKEQDQPPIWGVATDFKVGPFGQFNKTGILAKFYMKRKIETTDDKGNLRTITGQQALKEYPRPSIELWHNDNIIDWIALGRRRPERDLGLLMCAKNSDGRICYQKAPEGKIAYTMDPTEYPSVDKPGLEDTDEDELNPEEIKVAERTWKYFSKTYGVDKACTQYNAACGISPTNTAMPGQTQKEEPSQMAATPEEVLQYQKDIDTLKKSVETVTTENAALKSAMEKSARVSQYQKELTELAQVHEFNIEEELAEVSDLTPDQFNKHKGRIQKHYQKKESIPIRQDFIKTAVPNGTKEIDEEKLNRVLQYMRKANADAVTRGQYCTFDEAQKAVLNGKA